ncbi:hypothetical protein ABL78_2798 [Leptomonas seymouri]|uniref:Uncharacterized protein n=1 Tax=Leptomonas seymouri TaxID=5684 RepID=A0A0N1ILE3_LEPSE|nr:hypothetical protein ABL78_2798 [Leptomonas seymouri]|eukprot:KPI88111.1 hypothetical protein ABL78_2798 [Leptomonas seymouri]
MLCASLTLGPSAASIHSAPPSHKGRSQAPPVELLTDVYMCASSPVVTEEWRDWPHAPYMPILGGRAQPIQTAPPPTLPLPVLLQIYGARSVEQGSSFLQIIAIGAHSSLSVEAKAMVAGAATHALRTHLSHLLCNGELMDDKDDTAASRPLQWSNTLKRCCRFSKCSPSPSAGAVPKADVCDRKREGGTWHVTWSPELLTCVASSLSRYGPMDVAALMVCECRTALRTSLEVGVRARLLRDQHACSCSGSLEPFDGTLQSSPKEVESRCSADDNELTNCDAIMVRLIKCAPVPTHPLDVQQAIDLGCLLYRAHVRPAQEHAEDGAEAFKEVLRLAGQVQQGRADSGLLAELWQRALSSYNDSAVAAQQGVLFLHTHSIAAHGGASLTPLHVAEERARVQVAATAQQAWGCADSGAVGVETALAPLRLRSSGGAYFNAVVLVQRWDTPVGSAQSSATTVAKVLEEGDAALAPARAALHWRTHLGTLEDQPHAGFMGSTALKGATLQPTPLQWVLYTLRRQLIVAVANAAQVMLTGQRLHLSVSSLSSMASPAQPLSTSSLRAHAASCVKAQALLRGLLKWHCPYPVPPLLAKAEPSAAEVVAERAVAELLWGLRLLAKLHIRAAALYGIAGDVSSQQGQLRHWQDQLQRWSARRGANSREALAKVNEAGMEPTTAASWSTSVEDVVGHVDEAAWAAFVSEVSAGVPVAP